MAVVEMATNLIDETPDVMVDRPTLFAHQVKMLVWMGEFPAGCRFATEIRLPDEIKGIEQRQRPIDRREVDGWVAATDLRGHIVGGEMGAAVHQYLPHEPPGSSDPIAAPPENVLEIHEGQCREKLLANDSQEAID